MVSEREGPGRPYAPPANMIAVLQRLRRMNMPSRVGKDFLRGAGLSDAIIPRVITALKFLRLTNGADEPEDVLHTLASSSDEEYPGILEQVMRTAYAEDFENINPTTDPQARIISEFQRYTPRSQHERQVMLFLGLCREAGIPVVDAPRKRGMKQQRTPGRVRPSEPSPRQSTATRVPRGATTPRGDQNGQQVAEQQLGITMEDAARMPEEDFRMVWEALGTVFLRRAQRTYPEPQQENPNVGADSGQSETQDYEE